MEEQLQVVTESGALSAAFGSLNPEGHVQFPVD